MASAKCGGSKRRAVFILPAIRCHGRRGFEQHVGGSVAATQAACGRMAGSQTRFQYTIPYFVCVVKASDTEQRGEEAGMG
jgi:hypothetical protein